MYYLASPYSYLSKKSGIIDMLIGMWVRRRRYKAVSDAAIYLIKQGYTCIEPIAMCHHKRDLPTGYQFWKRRDRWFIRKCDGIVVLMLDGWKESEGVQDELNYARKLGKDVWFMQPNAYTLHQEQVKPKKARKNWKKNIKIIKSVVNGVEFGEE